MSNEKEAAPSDFDFVFVKHGWRGVENFFGARTAVNKRWLQERGADRLKDLRARFRKGDAAALSEVTNDG
ncbi:hypothetical protein GCM10007897_43850 [Sphingobium jiangsuense]|uniref:Uncharacterized protein n=1 Tax=Sphingobium jiangsuense TaxID=870476 RepID=A0A7W6FRB8_9SPHN|nr:hypothetical protein [Sphingobium jiangsuense]MBB3927840.1 hypothetical protein [Sphingobium jiangsuense]GLT02954.1 hypothetical protein GCM10007897_43850 [Sphingobium jiangsuense]